MSGAVIAKMITISRNPVTLLETRHIRGGGNAVGSVRLFVSSITLESSDLRP